MHVQCRDIICDITTLINDVTFENKKMHFGHGMSEVRYLKIA